MASRSGKFAAFTISCAAWIPLHAAAFRRRADGPAPVRAGQHPSIKEGEREAGARTTCISFDQKSHVSPVSYIRPACIRWRFAKAVRCMSSKTIPAVIACFQYICKDADARMLANIPGLAAWRRAGACFRRLACNAGWSRAIRGCDEQAPRFPFPGSACRSVRTRREACGPAGCGLLQPVPVRAGGRVMARS